MRRSEKEVELVSGVRFLAVFGHAPESQHCGGIQNSGEVNCDEKLKLIATNGNGLLQSYRFTISGEQTPDEEQDKVEAGGSRRLGVIAM